MITDGLIDSGSTISFVKKYCIAKRILVGVVLNTNNGLNKSRLEIFGKTLFVKLKESIKINL